MNVEKYIHGNFQPQIFFRLWSDVLQNNNLAPQQPARTIKGTSEHFIRAAELILKKLGYHRLDTCPGWYDVTHPFLERLGFSFTYGEDETLFDELEQSLYFT